MKGRKLLRREIIEVKVPTETKNNGSKLRRRPWWELPEYKSFPLVVDKWEDDGGIARITYYVKCPKHNRLTLLEVCIKGIFYFDVKDKSCKKCWNLPPKKNHPPPFINVVKENKVPEAMLILTAPKTKRIKIEKEVEENV